MVKRTKKNPLSKMVTVKLQAGDWNSVFVAFLYAAEWQRSQGHPASAKATEALADQIRGQSEAIVNEAFVRFEAYCRD